MRSLDLETTILSLTAPGTAVLSGPPAARLAREINEYAASVRDSDPRSFGFFAALPPILDSIEAAIKEIEYALNVLHADGITLYTRYGSGTTYLGHEDLVGVWKVLDTRKAVVFIHPTHSVDQRLVNAKLPQPMIDYPHETCRAIIDLLMNDRVRQFPQCRIITSHAGGTFPNLATRAAEMLPDYGLSERSAEDFLADARQLYYDLALSSNEYQLGLLLKFADPKKILFGTDSPYTLEKTIRTHTANLDEYCKKLTQEEVDRISRGNALRLFPRLAHLSSSTTESKESFEEGKAAGEVIGSQDV